MMKAWILTGIPRRKLWVRLVLPTVILYFFLIPNQVSLLTMDNVEEMELLIFNSAQLFFSLSALWILMIYFLPIYRPEIREVLVASRHPDIKCLIVLWSQWQFLCIPCYLWYGDYFYLAEKFVGFLIFQMIGFSIMFYWILSMSGSAYAAGLLLILYICASISLTGVSFGTFSSQVLFLIQYNTLWAGIDPVWMFGYGVFLGIGSILILVIKTIKHKGFKIPYKSLNCSRQR